MYVCVCVWLQQSEQGERGRSRGQGGDGGGSLGRALGATGRTLEFHIFIDPDSVQCDGG